MEVSTIAKSCASDDPVKGRRQETILYGMPPMGQHCAQSLEALLRFFILHSFAKLVDIAISILQVWN